MLQPKEIGARVWKGPSQGFANLNDSQHLSLSTHFEPVGTHSDPQSWYKDYFKEETFDLQNIQKEMLSELPLSD